MARSYASTVIAAPVDEVWSRIRDNHCPTIRATPVTDGSESFVGWWTTFDCGRDQIGHREGFFANEVFQGGFDALKAHFAR